jgi:tRNA A-37 threonylcarbamoyl transferase component Bud32
VPENVMSEIIDRLNTALEGRYRILEQIGEGGMATVYLADDLKHERKVAVKVLKPELAAVVGAERFLAEIKTTANLQHSHILPLYDSGQAESFLFFVMPYIEGETLRDRLEREKQLPVAQAVRIAGAVADALDYAHGRGIIHRDIKPGNILLQGDNPFVADFGIALAVGAAGGSRLTETGISVGSPWYMSPEQATGDRQVGPPSDIYSLGAVLYEMLTGEPPFIGTTAQAILGKIIQGGPISAAESRPSVPANVDATVQKALEKLPADRFPSAREFAAALANPAFKHGTQGGAVGDRRGMDRRRWLKVAGPIVLLLVLLGPWVIRQVGAGPDQPPVVVLMDSTHPARVYDSATIAEGGTNADDLTNALRDLPVVLVKENTNHTWNREEEVRLQTPALVVAHRSLFYNSTLGDNPDFAPLTAPMAWDKLELFMAFIAMGNPDTRFLVYSRGSWNIEDRPPEVWARDVGVRFPVLEGRVVGWQVPLDRATFRDSTTAGEIRAEIVSLLGFEEEG